MRCAESGGTVRCDRAQRAGLSAFRDAAPRSRAQEAIRTQSESAGAEAEASGSGFRPSGWSFSLNHAARHGSPKNNSSRAIFLNCHGSYSWPLTFNRHSFELLIVRVALNTMASFSFLTSMPRSVCSKVTAPLLEALDAGRPSLGNTPNGPLPNQRLRRILPACRSYFHFRLFRFFEQARASRVPVAAPLS